MALAIDASTPAFKGATGPVTTATSNSFSPPAGSVIFLSVQADGPFTSAQLVTSVTDSLGGHLNWQLRVRANGFASAGNCGGTAEWWWAPCPSAQVGMTVTATFTQTTGGTSLPIAGLLPIVMTGASSTQAGATATASNITATASAPTCTVAGVASGSRVLGTGCENHTDAQAGGTGQSTTVNGSAATGVDNTDFFAFWTNIYTANSAGGSIVSNVTTAAGAWNQCAVEVQAAPVAPILASQVTFLPRNTIMRGVRNQGQMSLFRERIPPQATPAAPATPTWVPTYISPNGTFY